MARKRERISRPNGDTFVRRDASGRFTDDQTSVGRSISQDMKRQAKNSAPKGQRDKGDAKGSR